MMRSSVAWSTYAIYGLVADGFNTSCCLASVYPLVYNGNDSTKIIQRRMFFQANNSAVAAVMTGGLHNFR
ncbi:hypothetical protein [Chitinophaga sp. sic0106]|uniref:hypothetical protein n=1 Tax=Chitinophaga sp. sic0106 TaxID=2854785 RepID=UPI001C488191|nr:hypothetical protein [Chitinophaga sp. sic0106]